MRSVLHAVYDSDDVLSGHQLWNALFALAASEDAEVLAQARTIGPLTDNDALGYNMARVWARDHHVFIRPESYGSPLTGASMRMGLNEKIMRRLLIEYIAQRPLQSAKRYLIERPTLIFSIGWDVLITA